MIVFVEGDHGVCFTVRRGRVGQSRCSLSSNNGAVSGLVLCVCLYLHCYES